VVADAGPPGLSTVPLAMLVKRFPRLSETFILNEILHLQKLGLPLRLHAVMDPRERQAHPEAEALRPAVRYLRSGDSPGAWLAIFPSAVVAAFRHPDGTARAIRFALVRRSAATWRHLLEALVLVRRMDDEGSRHLHAHFAHGPAAIAYLAHLISGVPFSFTAHAKDLYTTPPEHVALRAREASFVVTCTQANRVYLGTLPGVPVEKIVVCWHGVDIERFSAVARRPVPGRILSIGRLVPKKGFDVLLRALAILADRQVPFECRIVGNGPLADDLRTHADSLGITRHVAFLGARPQTVLLEEYAAAQVFALAPVVTADGDRDGIPNVLAEAMASGIPVISSSISGIPELILDGVTGALVPPGNPAALADRLERLLLDAGERGRLGSTGRQWVSCNWDLRTCVVPLADLLARSIGLGSIRTP
jgi:glycosyltransferase involved in cell wall biosynthesis